MIPRTTLVAAWLIGDVDSPLSAQRTLVRMAHSIDEEVRDREPARIDPTGFGGALTPCSA